MAIIIGTDPQIVIASNDKPIAISTGGSQGAQGIKGDKGDKGDTGDAGNFTGIANFTDANGFTGNITNNNLSLTLQYANATQDGQVTSTNFNDWQAKTNLTIGTTNITAFAGDLGAGAVSNITELQNLTTNLSTTSNTTTSILNGAVSNITTLQNQTTNLTESKLNITDALTLGSTNITAYRGDLGVAASGNITTLQGDLTNHTGNFTNPHNVTKSQVGLSNVTDVTPLELPVSNATQAALNGKQDTLVSGTNIKTINGDSLLGAGDLTVTGGNFTGIESFTDSGGFTGTVTNNSLSLVLQYANATQDGQITSTNYNDWQGKTNLTIGNTTTTAFQGDLGQVAYNHTSLTNNPHNVTKSQVGLSNVSDVTSLELPVSNATQTELNLKVDKTVTINGQNLSSNITLNVSLLGDITGSGSTNITTTLATVNSNTGIFGNATVVPSITVNEKGLITAASNNTIPTANTTTTGLVAPTKYNDWEAKGTSNLTIGTTTGTAYDGALGAGATSNITTLQGNVTNLTTDVNALNGAMRYIGGWDASSGAFPSSTQAGYVYSVTVDGTVDGVDFVATDRLLSILDNASTSTYSGNWLKEDYTDKVVSVNGQVGAVNLTTANVSASTNKRYVTDSQLVNITNLTGTNSGDQNLSGYVQDTRTINGQNLTTNITINHSTNSGLGWTSAGHTGANLTVAGFNATGAATELSISGNGTSILSNNNSDLGTPASGNLTNCNGTAANLTAGNVTNINVSNVTGTLAVANGGTGESTVSGWIALGACTYEAADSPTFQFSIAADVTGFLGVGNRIKLTQTTVKYFLVTAVGTFSSGKTIITVYGGTDYTLANAAITLPYFSIQKTPFGFPLDPAKWTVRLSDASTRSQASPTQNTLYNLGSLSLVMPIGAWCVNVQLCPYFTSTGSQVAADMEFGLSTSTSSFSDTDLKGFSYQGGASSTQTQINNFYRSKTITVASKATYYLVARTTLSTSASINFLGANSPSIVEFVSVYL